MRPMEKRKQFKDGLRWVFGDGEDEKGGESKEEVSECTGKEVEVVICR